MSTSSLQVTACRYGGHETLLGRDSQKAPHRAWLGRKCTLCHPLSSLFLPGMQMEWTVRWPWARKPCSTGGTERYEKPQPLVTLDLPDSRFPSSRPQSSERNKSLSCLGHVLGFSMVCCKIKSCIYTCTHNTGFDLGAYRRISKSISKFLNVYSD